MEFSYKYTLNEDDYLQYLRFMVSTQKGNKIKVWWIRLALPLLLLFTIYYFNLYKMIGIDILALLLSCIWIFVVADKIYGNFLFKRVNKNFVKNLNLSYKEIKVCFNDDGISIDGRKIDYENMFKIVPLTGVLLFFHNKTEVFIIPNRIIGEENIHALITYVDKKMLESRTISNEED